MLRQRVNYFERLSDSSNVNKKTKSLSSSRTKTRVTSLSSGIKKDPVINGNSQCDKGTEQSLDDNFGFTTPQLEADAEIENQQAKLGENLRNKRHEKTGSTSYNKAIVTKEVASGIEEKPQLEDVQGQDGPTKLIDYQVGDEIDVFGSNDFSEVNECIFEAHNCYGRELVVTFFERKETVVKPAEDFEQFCKMIDKLRLNIDDAYQEDGNITNICDEEQNNEDNLLEEDEEEEEEEEKENEGRKGTESEQNKGEKAEKEEDKKQTHYNDTRQLSQINNSSWLYNLSCKNLPIEDSEESSSDDFEVIKRHSLEDAEKYTERRNTMFSLDGNLVGIKGSASMESIFYEFSRGELVIDETILEDNFEDVEVGIRYKNKISRIKELITTEKNYIAGLGTVVNHYMPHLKMNEPAGLTKKTYYIFGNILEIYDGAKNFVESLQNCANDDVEGIADTFISFASVFDLYPVYAKNKTTADFYLPEFEQIYMFQTKQVELNDRRDLPGYLITPIQRLAQYVTLLHTMQKESIRETGDATKITEAIELMKNVMKKGNDLITIDSIKHCPVDLTTKGSLIMGEKFSVLKPESYQAMVFLFEQIIIFSKVSTRTTEFRYVTSIDLTNLKVESLKADLVTFQLSDFFKSRDSGESKKYTFELKALSARIKDLWTENIEKLLWQQLEEAKTHQNETQSRGGI